jgi:hypothetical protein
MDSLLYLLRPGTFLGPLSCGKTCAQ